MEGKMKVVKVGCPLVKRAFQDEKTGEIVAWVMNMEQIAKFLKLKKKGLKSLLPKDKQA